MKKQLLWALLAICCISNADAQQLTVEIGRVGASFDYTDSQGNGMDNLFSDYNFSYAAGVRFMSSEFLYPTASIIYSRYGVYGSDPETGNNFSWDAGYAGISLGLEGEVVRRGGLHAYVRLAAEPQFLTNGTQTINNDVYNLRGVEQFDSPFVFFRGGAGVNYCLISNVAIGLKYMYGISFPMGSDDTGETLRLRSSTISLGMVVTMGRSSYCQRSSFN
jgi:opacity protein-like surface antigen